MKLEKEILIAAFTPAFAERGVLWFSEHEHKIKQLRTTDPFWERHTVLLEAGLPMHLSELLRKLDIIRYEKTQTARMPGEFSVRGGTVTLYPINLDSPIRVEFLGNRIETIEPLEPEFSATKEQREKLLKREMLRRDLTHLSRLKEGDYLVHIDHGIGIYRGIKEGYLIVEYAPPKEGKEPDRLFVPETQAKKLSLYFGLEHPAIHRLSGTVWERIKKKVAEDSVRFAQELLLVYAKRESARRTPYAEDEEQTRGFEGVFPYIETEDQKKAIEDVYRDMNAERPMDRLVCGDVGFGKTEVAMRAAFRAVNAGAQVALLCPTTILADQHYETFKNRFSAFPISIGILSRFESVHAQKETIRRLALGQIDVLISTHRILSKDVLFKNLGLVIVDEEQRFGVRQKEKFKKMRESIDMLSLSATPIPRTLYLALSGLRKVSVISTPPLERQPIQTFVLPYDKQVIQKAVNEELSGGGQVYFLHNKVETLEATKRMLEELVPDAKFAAIHGKTPEKTLRDTMHKFKENAYTVLVATTLIENGLDIHNVNTLIVDDATRLGLAQAYQIRGRIGRSGKKAHAYFLYGSHKLSETAAKRLEALEEATELGSGYLIAKKDLEIRGAGNILGKKQSGAVNAVGLNLYCQMLSEAVEGLQGETS